MAINPDPRLTFDEYLELERAAEYKSDYRNGRMYAMSGGTGNHSRIAVNAIIAVGNALTGRKCSLFDSNMRIRTPREGACYYPDASATCERPLYYNESNDVLMNPVLIIEVLSPSTQTFDRGDKFWDYRSIPTFRDYVLVASTEIFAEHWSNTSGEWKLAGEFRDAKSDIYIASLAITLSVSAFYSGLELP